MSSSRSSTASLETENVIDLREGDTSFDEQETGETVIALSGGGYRAMLFHLGFLWRMRDAGMLARVDRFASVSGGSIVAGMVCRRRRSTAISLLSSRHD